MEAENFNQYESQEERIKLKIGTTRNGKAIIIRVPGFEKPFFVAVAYMEKVIESAKQKQAGMVSTAGNIKG